MGQKIRNGKIIVNAYLRPKESIKQAERLKEEFSLLGVNTEIVNSGFISSGVFGGEIVSSLKSADFIVYLDKDKYLSCELEKIGVRLFNTHNAIRVCDDKAETYIALSNNGLNIPDTYFGALSYSKEDEPNLSALKLIADKLGFPIIVKESYGSMGNGVFLANDFVKLQEIACQLKNKPHLFQKYLPFKYGTDIRVIVIGGKAISAMKRENKNDFRSNIAQGGVGTKYDLPDDFKSTAEKTAKILGLDYCGVDLLFGENGKPYICEVNSNAFFGEFEKVTGINIAKIYAEYIIDSLNI